ncbi:hypothetical protein RR48_00965 [Papilio machaon]|uniref:Uncharacterized protein n=1 Tax=Papilio machaon TaxID=76193 RepID=A0A0N1PGY2_PAPMA|nr:hypothetical protein RR48_00965 [Papilio machaon]
MNKESIVFPSGTDQEEYSGQIQEVKINGSNENQEHNEVTSEKLANDINDGKSQVVNNEIEYIDMNVNNEKDISDTPQQKAECERIMNTPQRVPAQTCIMGDVSLTPTHRTFTPQTSNPHNALVAITPIAMETSQAKSSIKLQ